MMANCDWGKECNCVECRSDAIDNEKALYKDCMLCKESTKNYFVFNLLDKYPNKCLCKKCTDKGHKIIDNELLEQVSLDAFLK